MSQATSEIGAAVSAAIDTGRLDSEDAQHLMGRMLCDAMGIELNGDAHSWPQELIALGLPAALIATAQAELRAVGGPPATPAPTTASATQLDRAGRVLAHIATLGDPATWEPATTYDALALALIDAVWSIGVRYTGVLNVLERYLAARRRDGRDANCDTPADLVAFIGGYGGPDAFAVTVANRQRTSSRNGILKADAVNRVAQVLIDAGIATPQDLAQASPDQLAEVRKCWTTIPGQGSGLSWDYFLMLAGRQGVKADRMVRRFVADALGLAEPDVSQREAHSLITGAAAHLDLSVSQLDYAIWLRQSGNMPA